MSNDVFGLEAEGAGSLALDEFHTLVLVEPAPPGQPGAEQALGWLLFRSGGRGSAAGHPSHGGPADLWFELSGRRLEGELIEQAGWDDRGTAAVAFFEARIEADRPALRSGPEAAIGGIKIGGQERVVELTRLLIEQIGQRLEPPVSR